MHRFQSIRWRVQTLVKFYKKPEHASQTLWYKFSHDSFSQLDQSLCIHLPNKYQLFLWKDFLYENEIRCFWLMKNFFQKFLIPPLLFFLTTPNTLSWIGLGNEKHFISCKHISSLSQFSGVFFSDEISFLCNIPFSHLYSN